MCSGTDMSNCTICCMILLYTDDELGATKVDDYNSNAVQFFDDATTSKVVLAYPPADKQTLYKLDAGGSVPAKR